MFHPFEIVFTIFVMDDSFKMNQYIAEHAGIADVSKAKDKDQYKIFPPNFCQIHGRVGAALGNIFSVSVYECVRHFGV